MKKKDLLTNGMAEGLDMFTQETPKEVKRIPVGVKKNNGAGSYQHKQREEGRQHDSTTTLGLKAGYVRTTIICKIETIKKMKEIAYILRRGKMEVIEEALAEYVAKYEKKNGVITLND